MTNPCGEFRKDMQKRIAPVGPQSAILPACSMTTIQTQSAPTTPMRPRSLYTTHSYHAQTEDANFQVRVYIIHTYNSQFSFRLPIFFYFFFVFSTVYRKPHSRVSPFVIARERTFSDTVNFQSTSKHRRRINGLVWRRAQPIIRVRRLFGDSQEILKQSRHLITRTRSPAFTRKIGENMKPMWVPEVSSQRHTVPSPWDSAIGFELIWRLIVLWEWSILRCAYHFVQIYASALSTNNGSYALWWSDINFILRINENALLTP